MVGSLLKPIICSWEIMLIEGNRYVLLGLFFREKGALFRARIIKKLTHSLTLI